MISVSDILKILDQVPVWRTVKELPKRVQALEEELAVLKEQMKSPTETTGEPCPFCGKHAMRMEWSTPIGGAMGKLGVMRESWKCQECGRSREKTTG